VLSFREHETLEAVERSRFLCPRNSNGSASVALRPSQFLNKERTAALEKAVAHASKPPQERKKSILELSAKGLKDAAETVKDVAPAILTTAGLIANFITGLQ
jgi:hypothetical protein